MFCGQCGAVLEPGGSCARCGAQVPTPAQEPATPGGDHSPSLEPASQDRGPPSSLLPPRRPDGTNSPRRAIIVGGGILAAMVVGLASLLFFVARSPASVTTHPMYQVGYREALRSGFFAQQAGGAAGICRSLIAVSDASDRGWTTEEGKRAYFDGCVAGYGAK